MKQTSSQNGLDPRKNIIIQGARVHNLKNISVHIPRNQFVVITGLSGSGKSSLAFNTLYAEGQRRYVESLSSYARQFLGRLDKPDVDFIRGISPAIAIEQKVSTTNARSTVGTSTEIYDYLKLLFARIGKTYSPISGKEVKRHHASDLLREIKTWPQDTKYLILAPLSNLKDRSLDKQLEILSQQGFSRVFARNEVMRIGDVDVKAVGKSDIYVVIDRLAVNNEDPDGDSRIIDSSETAFFEGHGDAVLHRTDNSRNYSFSNRFELDGISFEEPSVNFFTFNNPVGACRKCEGFGSVIGVDEDLVIPDKSRSIYDEAVACWKGEKMGAWKDQLVKNASKFDFPIHTPYHELSDEQKDILWTGNEHFDGLDDFFSHLEEQSYKIQYRVMLSRYRGKTNCPDCKGTRLRKDSNYVKIDGKSLSELVLLPIGDLSVFFQNLKLDGQSGKIAQRILTEIKKRLQYLCDVGLEYLTLNRVSNTLSGGESQRINLATSLGSSLVGSMYILDEPSIGLHPRDTFRLIRVLRSLQRLGNTVIVVEHDEEIMQEADYIIDMGPLAGTHGGEVVYAGPRKNLESSKKSLTAKYLTGELQVVIPEIRRKWKDRIKLKGVRQHNLKNIDVEIPLHVLTCITGVSGSGKSTLIRNVFYPAIKRHLGEYTERSGEFDGLSGDLSKITAVEFVDQNPIGKSSRSNPVTYVKAYDEIRALYSSQTMAKHRGYKPSHFSFNVSGGRCETCEGEGQVTISMQFMADIKLTCDTCKGKRFRDEILEVAIEGKNIADILRMTIDESMEFFSGLDEDSNSRRLLKKLQPLQDVGLGYITLGQASSTLSGGEAQRIKLASFLSKGGQGHTLFIFDEPTTGLHFHDVSRLLDSFNALISKEHTVVVIEHNADMIKSADWVIDLGPEGGERGGEVLFVGTPEDLVKQENSYTGRYLSKKINRSEKTT